MQNIIASLADKYSLTKAEVMMEIEAVFAARLSQWYRLEVMAFFREDLGLEAVAYNDSGGVIMQQPVDFAELKGRNTLTRLLEAALAKTAVLKQAARYKAFERNLLWGEIAAFDPERNLHIEVEIVPGERVLALCPLNRIGLHERQTADFSPGKRRAFHLRQVEPVFLNGTPRLKITVDRVSKTLVENLLKDRLGPGAEKIGFRCVKRYVGHKSMVLATRPLPKSAIIAVDRELKERIQVKIVKALPAG